MAGNRISVLIDVTVDKANKALGSFKTKLDEANGASSKFKVGASAAMDSVKANAANMALAGGAALVAFSVKAVSSFQNAALAAGKFADMTNMSTEAASEWLKVAERNGMQAGDLADAFNNVAGKIAEGDPIFEQLGATITRTTDGAVDLDATMQDVVKSIGAIEDPAEKARIASALLGEEGSRQFAELTGEAGRLAEQLGQVAEADIIDEEEVRKARELRDAQRELGVAVQDLQMAVGELLVPALTDMAESMTGVYEVAKRLKLIEFAKVIQEWVTPLSLVKKGMDKILPSYRNATQAAWDYALAIEAEGGSFDRALEHYESLTAAIDEQVAATKDAVAEALLTMGITEEISAATKEHTDAILENNEGMERAIDLAKQEEEGLRSIRDARRLGTDQIYAAKDAEDAWWKTVASALETMEDVNTSAMERAAVAREVATATDELVSAQLIAQGVDLDSVAGMEAWTDAMLRAAQGLSGPLRDEVLNYISLISGMDVRMKGAGTQIGEALADGIVAGLKSHTGVVEKAAGDMVNKAVNAAKLKGLITSPSKLFRDEVGKPIAQGVAAGIEADADKIGDALVKAIDSAEDKATDAAEDLVRDVQSAISDFWGGIDDARSEEDLRDAVTEANEALAEAVASGDADKVAQAQERLEDASYRLAKATVDQIYVDQQSRDSWRQTAAAAGLTAVEIDGLIAAYDRLSKAKHDAHMAGVDASAEATASKQVIGRFNEAVGHGLVSPEELAAVGGMAPGAQISYMKEKLNSLDRLFGVTPMYGASTGGGITINVSGALDPNGTARAIVDALATAKRNGMVMPW